MAEPKLYRTSDRSFDVGGQVGALLKNVTERWLLNIRETNPAILDMYRDANKKPYRKLMMWSGEFAGKYLTAASQIYAFTHNEALGEYLRGFVEEMLSYQQENGYLGAWSEEYQLSGKGAESKYYFDKNSNFEPTDTWDAWSNYHVIQGLLAWYEATGDDHAFSAALRIADCFMNKFYGEDKLTLHDTGWQDMNLAPYHAFAKLYRKTGDERYRDFALKIEKDMEREPAGDYLRMALSDTEFYLTPKPRWESLHAIEGFVDMYYATSDENYKKAALQIWESITRTDVHNTGGFSTHEQAIGHPFENGPIETCCVIAYMAFTLDILGMSKDVRAADVLEWSFLNSMLGSFSPSGRWSTYNTPMEGYKRANYHEIGFQCLPGSPDLNCCSVNAPRAFGMLGEWGCMTDKEGRVYLNYYGAGSFSLDNGDFRIVQQTEYPYNNTVKLTFCGGSRTVMLRIPEWSKETVLYHKGESVRVQSGAYYELAVSDGDEITLVFDFSPRIERGERDYEGKISVFCGPLLMCFDPYYDDVNEWENIPDIDVDTLSVTFVEKGYLGGGVFKIESKCGKFTACDLYAAGVSGNPYTTWFLSKGENKYV